MTNNTISHDLNAYGFTTEIRVRLCETDAVGIVFFGSFPVYFDVGRMDYLANLGLHTLDGTVRDLIPGAVVHQSAQFYRPARYNDVLIVHVRIAELGRSSYTFHFLVTNKKTRARISSGKLTMVWLDNDFKPMAVPEQFRAVVCEFEGERVHETKTAPPASTT
ncbi:MAG: thioesterase family protein [Myxococcota bacterium]|nr:thioesterase family protein [Myxococcota bacterium]